MSKQTDSTRRDFIKASTATAGAAAIAFPTVTFGKPNSAKLKIGWIGCGGRGSGAINQALAADSNIELHAIGEAGGKPVPPLNLVGDFGGGGMVLAFGIVCALLEAQKSGKGQVVDTAMVDGAAALMAMFFSMQASGAFRTERGTNMLDGGAHFYGTYETKDGKYISLGSIEPQFYALLVEKAGLDTERFSAQMDGGRWDEFKAELTQVFKTKTRDEWRELMEGTDVCFAPVLALDEVHEHPHNIARNSFLEIDGIVQPAPAPRFSRSEPATPTGSRLPGQDSRVVLQDAGFSDAEIESMISSGAVTES